MGVEERVSIFVIRRNGLAALLIENGKQQVETAEKLDEPLVNERPGHQDQDAGGDTAEMKPVEDQAGFDGFAKSHLIGQQHPRMKPARGFGDDGKLVWNQVDARAGESPRGRTSQAGIPIKGLQPLLEFPGMTGQPCKKPFFRLDEMQRVGKLALGDVQTTSGVAEQSVIIGNLLNLQFASVAVADHIPGDEADPDERRGTERVGPGFLSGGKPDLDNAILHRQHPAEPQSGLGMGDPSLSGNGRRHAGIRIGARGGPVEGNGG